MSVLDELLALDLGHEPPTARWYGVYPALVTDIKDPDGQGRVKVALPWSPDGDGASYAAWARLATLMAGNGRGSWFIPDVDDEVLVGLRGRRPAAPVRPRRAVERHRRAAARRWTARATTTRRS